MKSILLAVLSVVAIKAQAHEHHTPNYCSKEVPNFCAHLGFHTEPKVGEAFEFVVDLVTTKENLAAVTSANVELFMSEMGHGTAPVKVQRLDAKHFQVTEAYFVMEGKWSVNVDVITANGTVRIEIPMEIK